MTNAVSINRITRDTWSTANAVVAYDDEKLRWTEEHIFDRYFTTPGRVLDLGCGTGRTSRHLARRGHEVTGIDYSSTMLGRARELSTGVPLRFLLMNAMALGFADRSFDYCLFAHNGIDYLYPESSRTQALHEMYRVLNPGGVLAFSSHNSLWVPTKPGAILDLLKTVARGKILPYRWEFGWYGKAITHWITPRQEINELLAIGFRSVTVISRYSTDLRKITLLDPFPSYVCDKPN